MTVYEIQLQRFDYRCDNSRIESWNSYDDPVYADTTEELLQSKLHQLNNELAQKRLAELKEEGLTSQSWLDNILSKWAVEDALTEVQRKVLGVATRNEAERAVIVKRYEEKIASTLAKFLAVKEGRGNSGYEPLVKFRYIFDVLELAPLDDLKAVDMGDSHD